MKISSIYKIQSKIKPKKIYIGSAINFNHRKIQHLHILRKNEHYNKKLQNHFNKYGESDLQFSILLGCEKEDLIKIEQYFIDFMKPWFNNAPIAGNCLGVKHSDDIKRKLSERQKGKKLSEEHKKNIGLGNKGKILSEETKNKMRLSAKDKKLTKEHKQKLSDSHKGLRNNLGKKRTEESKKRQSEKMKGRRTCPKFTIETREKMRFAKLGNKNPMYGKHYD